METKSSTGRERMETKSSTGRERMETKAAKTSTRPTTRYEAALCNYMCENVQIIVSKGFSLSDPTQSNENRKRYDGVSMAPWLANYALKCTM